MDQWKSVAACDDGEKQAARVRAVGRLECMICAVVLDKKNREFAKMEDAALAVLKEFSMEIEKPLDPPQALEPFADSPCAELVTKGKDRSSTYSGNLQGPPQGTVS